MLLHHMNLVSFRLLRKKIGQLARIFEPMVNRPSWPKIGRRPMRAKVDKETMTWMGSLDKRIVANESTFRILSPVKINWYGCNDP